MLLTLRPQYSDGQFNEYTAIHRSHPTPRSSWSDCESSGPSSMESSGRELPPPSVLALPQPAMPNTTLPPPPSQWQGTDTMQQWLIAKAEEDRRSQEEEKTRQEALRLEQRKVEQMILLDSLRAGVPPPMVPLLFAGMNNTSGSSAQLLIDAVQQLASQTSRSAPGSMSQPSFQGPGGSSTLPPLNVQPSQSQASVGVHHRDMRTLATGIYAPQQPLMRNEDPPPLSSGGPSAVSSSMGTPASLPTYGLRAMEMQQPPTGQHTSIGLAHHLSAPPVPQGTPVHQDSRPRRYSPSISFHHWVPPGSQSQASSSGKEQPESTASTDPPHHLTRADNQSYGSPSRKRKSHAAHTASAAPATRSSEFAPRQGQSDRHSPTLSSLQQQQHTSQSAIPTRQETKPSQGRPGFQRWDSVEKLSPRMRRRRSTRSLKLEYETPPVQSHVHISDGDADNTSDRSQDTGDSTKSGVAGGKPENP